MITVREIIHHGQYYNVQDSTAESLETAFALAVKSSPYNARASLSAPHVVEALRGLTVGCKRVGIGWADYEIVGGES